MTQERLEELKEAVYNLSFGKIPSLDDIYGLQQVLDEVGIEEWQMSDWKNWKEWYLKIIGYPLNQ